MSVLESLRDIHREAMEALARGRTAEEVEQLRVATLGKNGRLTAILRTMGKLEKEERAASRRSRRRLRRAGRSWPPPRSARALRPKRSM